MRTAVITCSIAGLFLGPFAMAQNATPVQGLLGNLGGSGNVLGINAPSGAGALGLDVPVASLTDSLSSGLDIAPATNLLDGLPVGAGDLPDLGGLGSLPALGGGTLPADLTSLNSVVGDSLPAALLPADTPIPLNLLDADVVTALFDGALPVLPGGSLPVNVPAGALPDGLPVPLSAISPATLASVVASGVPAGALPGNMLVPVSMLNPALVNQIIAGGIPALPAGSLPTDLMVPADALGGLDPTLAGSVVNGLISVGSLPDDIPVPTSAIDPGVLGGVLSSSLPAGLLPADTAVPVTVLGVAQGLPGL